MFSIFTRTQPKTVAAAMATFQTIIADLDQIAEDNMALTIVLEEQRAAIDANIEMADSEVASAKQITSKLNNLLGLGYTS